MTPNTSVENLFNITDICNAVIEQNKPLATELFDKKTFFFMNTPCGNVGKCPNIQLMSVFLNSLNMGIYNSALSSFGCNLQQCCFNNTQAIGQFDNIKTFVLKGQDIISSYTSAINAYLSENGRCQHRLYITQAKQYIEKHIEDTFTLEDVANAIYISPAYLSTLFNNLTGTTYSSYVNSIKIDMAKHLLLTTQHSITDISIQCGFNQASYFATAFKKVVGVTPKQFRSGILSSTT